MCKIVRAEKVQFLWSQLKEKKNQQNFGFAL